MIHFPVLINYAIKSLMIDTTQIDDLFIIFKLIKMVILVARKLMISYLRRRT